MSYHESILVLSAQIGLMLFVAWHAACWMIKIALAATHLLPDKQLPVSLYADHAVASMLHNVIERDFVASVAYEGDDCPED